MHYFCIFVLTFQNNIKLNNCPITVFFAFVVEKRAFLLSADCLRAIKPHLITTHALFYNCEAACDTRLFKQRQAQQNENTLVAWGTWTISPSHCLFTAPGSHWSRQPGSQAACGGCSPPPVRAASDRPRARSHGQSNPGRVVFASLGSSSCSALGGRHRGAAGCCLVLTHLCVRTLLCFCAFLLPRTSIWFDFRDIFTPPSKYPFITQATE